MKEQTPMTEQDLASIIRGYIDVGNTYASDHYNGNREVARDYYYSRGDAINAGDVCVGDSDVISADVPDSIDATLAAMLPAFSATDLLAEFEADSAEDEDAAEEESKIVSHILVDGNSGVIRQAIFDCLLLRNTGIKVSWESNPETSIDKYENLTIEQMAMAAPQLMEEDGDVEPTEIDENEDGTFNVTLRRKTPRGIPTIQCIPLGELTVNASHNDINVADAKFVAHSPCDVTASDLIEMGFDADVVDRIPDYLDVGDDSDVYTRDWNESNTGRDRSTRNVDVHEAFMMVDFDGDGIAERRRVILGGSTILFNEEVPAVQIITGSCWPMPHQWEGVSLFDRLKQIQDTKTTLTRQSIDVNNYNLLQRVVVNPLRVELDDLETGSRRGIVRAKAPATDVVPFPPLALDASTPSLLAQMDKMRSERAGGALDMNMENLPVGANTTAHGVERIMSAMETMVAAYINNFSQTVIRPLYIEIHRLLRMHGAEMQMNIDGSYITTDPSKWKARTKLNVVTGAGLGEQSRKGQAMINVLLAQKELMMSGSGLVNESNLYESLLDSAKYSGLDYPEQYFIDPASPEAQQAAQQKQQAAQQAQQAAEQKEQQLAQFQMSLVNLVEETKKQGQMLKAMQDKAKLDLEVEKEKNDFTLAANEQELKYDTNVPGAAV